MIIDGHIHAGYWSERFFLGRGSSFEEMDRCLEECGIEGAVLTTTDLRKNDPVLEFIEGKREAAAGASAGGRGATVRRYWFFPWVNPDDTADLEYIKANRSSIHGIKFHPSCDKVRMTDARVAPFLDYASEEGLPAIVHCGRWQEMSSYRLALDAAEKYEGVNFILSHMGGDIPELEMGTIDAIQERGVANAFLGIEGVREYWAVQRAVDELGAERVIFGSDFPLGHPRMYMGLVDALSVSDRGRALILGGNVLRLVGEA